jgi:uncharacterized protein involved in exopolysaccharide biosynthesis
VSEKSPDWPGRAGSVQHRRMRDDEGPIGDAVSGAARDPAQDGAALDAAWRIAGSYWWLIAAAIVATAAAAYAFSAAQAPRYRATADLLLASSDATGASATGSGDPARDAATTEALLGLPVVAQRAARLVPGATADEISGAVSVVSTPNTDLVEIVASDRDPRTSAQIANAYGTAFIDFRMETAKAQIDDALRRAQRQEATLSASDLAGDAGTALRDRIGQLQEARASPGAGARLVQPASPPASASSPRPIRTAILGAGLGAVLGFVVAAVGSRRRRALHTPAAGAHPSEPQSNPYIRAAYGERAEPDA